MKINFYEENNFIQEGNLTSAKIAFQELKITGKNKSYGITNFK